MVLYNLGQAYAASDFILMPSAYEPCGLSQMVAQKYGSLPIVHRTGGLADSVRHLDPDRHKGNGFCFEHHDTQGLRWAIEDMTEPRLLAFGRTPAST